MYNPIAKTKHILCLFTLTSTLLLIISLQHSTPKHKLNKFVHLKIHTQNHLELTENACQGTRYPDLCISTLSTLPHPQTRSLPQLITATINRTILEVELSASNCSAINHRLRATFNSRDAHAINDCLELFENTIFELNSAVADLSKSATDNIHELHTLLSAAMTNQYTCLDGFAFSKGKNTKYNNPRQSIEYNLYNVSRHVSNSLAMLNKIPGVNGINNKNAAIDKDISGYGNVREFPKWMPMKDRKLLQAQVNETKFDLVVAKDGSGNFTTIGDAVAAAPNSSVTRFVIYIKGGAYFENVEVERKKTMLMFVGDGIGKTVVKSDRNVVDGWTTFRSATVAVVGKGFIAKGITFENSAGPSKHQAVALRSGSDLSAFYKCSFVAYQDTLYVHSLRQFYRECDVYGTVDFIFGNAAVVLQNCNLYARKPNPNQKNIFTAQGREDPNQNTGISIINCKLAAASDLIPVKSSFKSFLGRPWKTYSRTVIIRSFIDDLVDPAGWLEWNGSFALDTLYYGEYLNRGPGSNTSQRVTWPGYRVINSASEAGMFTVGPFIQGNEWLNSTSIPFTLGLN